MSEIWKEIPSHPNYEASNTGFIRHKKKKNILKTSSSDNRHYQVISIITDGKKYTKKVARLVWEAFNGCPCGLTIDHIDRNPLNNHIDNLRCVSNYVNCQNRLNSGIKNKYNISDELKKEIITSYLNGELTTWKLSFKYNIPFNYITTVVRRGSWNKFYQKDND